MTAAPIACGPRVCSLGSLQRWAADTWRSLAAMAHLRTGLVSDGMDGQLENRNTHTSPTNIGGYLWSTLVARELGIIPGDESRARIAETLRTLAGMERHDASGMYFNWYDAATAEVITRWPVGGHDVTPFVSSVDSAWLGAALWVVAQADPANSGAARELFDRMRWDVFFDPGYGVAGAMHGGFHVVDPPRRTDGDWGVHLDGTEPVWYTANHYITAVSETRMTTYLAIMTGQVPERAYFGTWRAFPPGHPRAGAVPVGQHREYLGVAVYEGALRHRDTLVVPSWGGSMFEALMPDLFVPEAAWGPRSWGRNHPLYVRAHREHGLDECGYGFWGFSPSSDPDGGYREYGVDALGLFERGYHSRGVVTPHASFLAMMHEPDAAVANLERLETDLRCYGPGGFLDAADTRTGRVADRYLSLDQAMTMAALGNVVLADRMREWFATDEVERRLRPLLEIEEFGAAG